MPLSTLLDLFVRVDALPESLQDYALLLLDGFGIWGLLRVDVQYSLNNSWLEELLTGLLCGLSSWVWFKVEWSKDWLWKLLLK